MRSSTTSTTCATYGPLAAAVAAAGGQYSCSLQASAYSSAARAVNMVSKLWPCGSASRASAAGSFASQLVSDAVTWGLRLLARICDCKDRLSEVHPCPALRQVCGEGNRAGGPGICRELAEEDRQRGWRLQSQAHRVSGRCWNIYSSAFRHTQSAGCPACQHCLQLKLRYACCVGGQMLPIVLMFEKLVVTQ